jgi:predicted flap endonuclease-1-like 5' DNA nuclease
MTAASTRFNSAAPVAPPRPSGSIVPRPSSIPRASALPGQPSAPAEKDVASELRDQLEAARRAVTAKEAEVHVIVAQRDARIAELEGARAELAARDAKIKELEATLLSNETKLSELAKELESARAMASGAADDLKLIKGIGPAFERELRKLGIVSFAQIAAWSAEDIEQIAPKIKAKPDRIRRDEWIQRASELAGKSEK